MVAVDVQPHLTFSHRGNCGRRSAKYSLASLHQQPSSQDLCQVDVRFMTAEPLTQQTSVSKPTQFWASEQVFWGHRYPTVGLFIHYFAEKLEEKEGVFTI